MNDSDGIGMTVDGHAMRLTSGIQRHSQTLLLGTSLEFVL
jgi:hypothetical protein